MSNLLDAGRITGVHGIKGWLKVNSQTEPAENLFHYSPWFIKTKHGVKSVEIEDWRPHGKGFVAKLVGVDTRDQAESLAPVDIAIEKQALDTLEDGEYYWYQLEGLRVISHFDGQRYDFGTVKKLLSTGANDVLVVVGDDTSMDQTERLIPYVPDQYITSIDINEGVISVDWDPEF